MIKHDHVNPDGHVGTYSKREDDAAISRGRALRAAALATI